MPIVSIDEIKARVGSDLGTSSWLTVDQQRINAFAEVTEDHQPIHIDPAFAAQTPFGGAIAHGFLTLSLLTRMCVEVMTYPEATKMVVNYRFDRVRFLSPVKSGSRIRGTFHLASFEEKRPGQYQFTLNSTVEIENEPRPALQADWIGMIFV